MFKMQSARNCHFQALSLRVIPRIDNTPTDRLILHIMPSFAEFEREMIKERTVAGKAIARQKPGYKEGRPKQITPEIIKQIKKGVSWEELGISRTTWYRYK